MTLTTAAVEPYLQGKLSELAYSFFLSPFSTESLSNSTASGLASIARQVASA